MTHPIRPSRQRRRTAVALSATLATVITGALASTATPSVTAAPATTSSAAVPAADFAAPAMEYRPGVRWWWPGGAVDTAVLEEQLTYLAANGFGTVEVNPFDPTPLPGDEARVRDLFTPAYYEKLEFAVAKAQQLGITVDLNMGAGWNANSPYVTLDDSEGNMALGRRTQTGAQLKAGSVAVPALAKSRHYGTTMPKYDPTRAKLQGVLVAKRTGTAGTVTGDAASFDDGATTWSERVALDVDQSFVVPADRIRNGAFTVTPEQAASLSDGDSFEVVGIYVIPAGSGAVHAARTEWYVVDHMSAAKTLDYVNDWVGEENLNRIVDKYDNVRALFNDSLELSTDLYYNQDLYDLAGDPERNGLGYDFTKFLPTVYRQNLRAQAYRPNTMSGSAESYLTYTPGDTNRTNRILADYRRMTGTRFMEGLRGFQRGTNSHGLKFRQQAYNTPLDMIGAARYVDIPEEEQHDEYRLRTAAAGGHLYDRNLITAEQYTLGLTPLQNTLDSLKVGFDLMTTAGVNNFFYHGLSYPYGKGSAQYGENGWNAFPTIGVNVSAENTLSKYFGELNAYASRLNYVGQQGDPSMDVAVYAPFNTRAVATGATPTLNRNGYAWDVINDASITAADTTYRDGKLRVNGDAMDYDALVVHTQTVPVATMQAMLRLARQGAPIIFYGALPNAQDGYANGNWAAEDRKVSTLATEILLASPTTYQRNNPEAFAAVLDRVVDPEVTYDANDEVRFMRRSLADGAELTYIRNTATTANTITVRADDRFENYYWLDQKTGKVYRANAVDDVLTFTLDPGGDALGRGATPAKPSNGIVLLAEPAGSSYDASELSPGQPDGLNRVAPESVAPVNPTSLTVTADNLDGVIGGETTTQTFTDTVLGNWKDASFQGGRLQSVVADGVYRAVISAQPVPGRRYLLNLGTVHTAAAVTVNGERAGSALFAPYEVDITDRLRAGENQIEIAVTPRKKNRYFPAPGNTNGQFSMAAPQDAGLVGPITLQTSARATAPTAPQPSTPSPTPTTGGSVTAVTAVTARLKRTRLVAGRTHPVVVVRTTTNTAAAAAGRVTVKVRGGKSRTVPVTSGTTTVRLPTISRPGRRKIVVTFTGTPVAQNRPELRVRVVRR